MMTEDTRRALQIIEPIASVMGIEVEATDSILYMDDQAIAIGCNSTYATLMEMIGWIFWEKYVKCWRNVKISYKEVDDTIKRSWIKKSALAKILMDEEVTDS